MALDLEPRSGPIVIEITYTIEPGDMPAFLAVMAERERMRRRDGARHWTLLRDLEHPDSGWRATARRPGPNMCATT